MPLKKNVKKIHHRFNGHNDNKTKKQYKNTAAQSENINVDYKNEILRRAIFILVTGDESREFAQIAENDFKCFKLSGKTFYEEINSINESFFNFEDDLLSQARVMEAARISNKEKKYVLVDEL